MYNMEDFVDHTQAHVQAAWTEFLLNTSAVTSINVDQWTALQIMGAAAYWTGAVWSTGGASSTIW